MFFFYFITNIKYKTFPLYYVWHSYTFKFIASDVIYYPGNALCQHCRAFLVVDKMLEQYYTNTGS